MTRETSTDTDTRTDRGTEAEKRDAVRDRYGAIGAGETETRTETTPGDSSGEGDCSGDSSESETSCCGGGAESSHTETLGYDPQRLDIVPEGANLGLGCGNPTAIAELESGETVLDLGSGGGFDCFLAAEEVGPDGQIIGVDMTPEMLERARQNAGRSGFENVGFRLGEIEHLPVADESVDAIMSNCVVNLSPAKERVFEEASRVLKPGGRLAISDIALTEQGSQELDDTDLEQYAACVSGAATIAQLESLLEEAGFESVSVRPKAESESIIRVMYDDPHLQDLLYSARISARKPQ
ncbi:arsenite methyltransferase [Halodesulfurarchaeum sp.]|uniref:arsenite methyltransferase n=1 Tax=Halodesulfurarchaeum sp. TaxID=1980530 RepID=UPI001BC4A6D7|nr:arsenite methyltransferase [Halodesulfurarchaeum sp.]